MSSLSDLFQNMCSAWLHEWVEGDSSLSLSTNAAEYLQIKVKASQLPSSLKMKYLLLDFNIEKLQYFSSTIPIWESLEPLAHIKKYELLAEEITKALFDL